jgi:adenylate cyclase
VDRFIWSAIGNTTNLAARLQALTRNLGAAIAMDRATYEAAGAAAAGFELRPRVAIRGRDEPVDVYALPAEALA